MAQWLSWCCILSTVLLTASQPINRLPDGTGIEFQLNTSLYITITSGPFDWIRVSLYSELPTTTTPIAAPYLSTASSKPVTISNDPQYAGVATKTNVLAVDLSQGSSNWTLSNADSSQVVLLSDILADITPDGSLRLLLGRAGNVYGSSIPSGTDVKAPTPLTSSSGSTTASSHSTQTPTFWDDRGFRVFSVPVDLVAASQVDTQPVSWSVDGTTLAITTVASRLDVYFTVASNVQNGVASLWELTSPPSLLPSWAFGLQVSSETWASADALDEVITQARSGYSGLDTVIMDYHWFASTDDSEVGINGSSDRQDFDFDKVYFRTPAADRLADWHGKNVRVGGMRWPRLTNNASLDTARVQGCVVADSRTWNLTKNSCQQLLSTDLNAVVTKGLDLFWNDQLDVNASNYLETNQWASAQGTTLGSKVRVYGWTRSYVPGLQSLGYATIGDEVDSTWTGLQQAVSMMLHAQLVGQSFAAPMMGGSSAIQDPALLVRSYQSAALMPIMRMHLPASDPNRLPFAIADSSVRAAVDRAVQLRYWLLPFIYSHHRRFINDPNNVRPLITPMASVCLPEDGKACMQCLNQWLVADSLLAAPVLESGSTIEVMFPSFQPLWYYFNTTNSFNNTRTQSLDIDLDQVPMFAAVGAIIPVGCSVATHANEPSLDPLLVHVYTGVDGALMFELDDGLSVGGAVLRTNFTWDDDRQGLSWDVVGTLETPLYALIQAVAFFPDLAEPLYSNVRTFTGSGFFSFQQLYKQARFGSD